MNTFGLRAHNIDSIEKAELKLIQEKDKLEKVREMSVHLMTLWPPAVRIVAAGSDTATPAIYYYFNTFEQGVPLYITMTIDDDKWLNYSIYQEGDDYFLVRRVDDRPIRQSELNTLLENGLDIADSINKAHQETFPNSREEAFGERN